MMNKNAMVRAWEIAREGANKFGGSVKEYFSQALIMAWKEQKSGNLTEDEITVYNIIKQSMSSTREIERKTKWDIGRVHSVMMHLVLKKKIFNCTGTGYYEIIK